MVYKEKLVIKLRHGDEDCDFNKNGCIHAPLDFEIRIDDTREHEFAIAFKNAMNKLRCEFSVSTDEEILDWIENNWRRVAELNSGVPNKIQLVKAVREEFPGRLLADYARLVDRCEAFTKCSAGYHDYINNLLKLRSPY